MCKRDPSPKPIIGPACAAALVAASLAFFPMSAAAAQEVSTASKPLPFQEFKITKIVPSAAGLGATVELQFEGLSQWVAANKIDPNAITVFIDSTPMTGLPVHLNEHSIRVHLITTSESAHLWEDLLNRPTFTRQVRIGIGKAGGGPVVSSPFELVIIPRQLFAMSLLIVAAAAGAFGWLARTTSIIRDPNPAVTDPRLKAFSLGKSQMAIWYFLVLAAFLFIWTIRGSPPKITDEVLGLIGIASGTALGSAAIDIRKNNSARASLANSMRTQAELNSELAALHGLTAIAAAGGAAVDQQAMDAATTAIASKSVLLEQSQQSSAAAQRASAPPLTTSFLEDLLTDSDGMSFHRFQIVIWTLVLLFVFSVSVWRELKMPAFDTSLLALMGISSGTYLGFKFPEKQV